MTELEPDHPTSGRLLEAGLSMAKIGPLMTAHLPVLSAIGDEVKKAKTIHDVLELLGECLGAKAASHLHDLLAARENTVATRAVADERLLRA